MTASPGYDHALRIAVRSDRRLFRDALAACLATQPGYTVVGHASDLDDLVELCELRTPDIALVEVGPGLGTGDRTLRLLADCLTRCRVIVVYERLSAAELAALSRLGVDTLVPCSHGLDALLLVLARHRAARPAPRGGGLSDREHEIITLVSAGHTVDRIAELLEVSASTVANTKRRIYHKLDVASQSQAVARAATLGLVGGPVSPLRRAGAAAAIVRGARGRARKQVAAALRAGKIPYTIEGYGESPDGSRLTILVDPTSDDWPAGQPVVLVCSVLPRRAQVLDALLRGAVALVAADRVAEDLVPAVALANQGYLAVHAGAADAVLDAVRTPYGLPELTSRESDILRSIADGHTVRQTARTLGIACKTVENTQARLFRKLGARNRAGAVAAAHTFGLLEPA